MEKLWFNSMLSNEKFEYSCGLSKSMGSLSLNAIGHTSGSEEPVLNDTGKHIPSWSEGRSYSFSNVDYLFDIRDIWSLVSDNTFLVRDSQGNNYSLYFDIENQIFEIDNDNFFLSELESLFSCFFIFNSGSKSNNHYYYNSTYDTQSGWNNHMHSCINSYLRCEVGINNYIFVGTNSGSLNIKGKGGSNDNDSHDNDSNEKDSDENDSHDNYYHDNDSNKNDSHDNENHDNDSKENDSHENDSHYDENHDNDSNEKDSHENDSNENDSHENDFHDSHYHDNDSNENDSHENDSHSHDNYYHDNDFHDNENHENHFRDNENHDNDSHYNYFHDNDSHDNNFHENYFNDNDFHDNDSHDNDSNDNDSDSDINAKYRHLWVRCENCYGLNYKKFFRLKMSICEQCGYHLKMSSSDRIEFLIDQGTWDPMDEDMVSTDPIEFHSEEEPYKDRIHSYQRRTGLTEAVQTGIGQLNGIPIAIGVMDFQFIGGSMGSVVGEKITRLIEYATNQSLPVIIVCASGGARMQEGSVSLMQMAKISSASFNYQSNKKLFYVSILTSPTTGGVTASFGMLGDVIIAEPNAYIAFAGKRVIEQTLNKIVPEGSQEAEYSFDKGLFDLIVPRNPLKGVLSELFQLHGFFPLNKKNISKENIE